MDFDWLRRRHPSKPQHVRRPQPILEVKPSFSGPPVVVERLDDDPQGRAIIAELGDRYEVADLDGVGKRFRVVVEDAFESDEAVVRLASQLDEIDPEWQRYLSWPRSADRLRPGG
jgi:hypothetical protein